MKIQMLICGAVFTTCGVILSLIGEPESIWLTAIGIAFTVIGLFLKKS